MGITIRVVPLTDGLLVPAVEDRRAIVLVSPVVFRDQGMADMATVTIVQARVVRSIHRAAHDQVCPADQVLFHVQVGAEGPADRVALRPLAPCRKTRVRRNAALRQKGPPTLARKKNLRCRKNSCRPRRR